MSHYILAIDPGRENLGWCLYDKSMNDFKFNIFNIGKPSHGVLTVEHVINRICIFFDSLPYKPYKVIIERQVQVNTQALELMYALAMYVKLMNIPLCIFDPKLKFTLIDQTYDTRNKNHKKLSIRLARGLLSYKQQEELDIYDKKDDIADAINMCICESHDRDKHILHQIYDPIIESFDM